MVVNTSSIWDSANFDNIYKPNFISEPISIFSGEPYTLVDDNSVYFSNIAEMGVENAWVGKQTFSCYSYVGKAAPLTDSLKGYKESPTAVIVDFTGCNTIKTVDDFFLNLKTQQ